MTQAATIDRPTGLSTPEVDIDLLRVVREPPAAGNQPSKARLRSAQLRLGPTGGRRRQGHTWRLDVSSRFSSRDYAFRQYV